MFLAIVVLFIFNTNLSAAKYHYKTKCPQWNLGGIAYYNGVEQNRPFSAVPSEFCWDIVKIEGLGIYNRSFYGHEILTRNQSLADWYAWHIKHVYGEDFVGIYVTVVVFGHAPRTPIVVLNNSAGNLIEENDIISPNGSTYNGKEFKFFIRHKPLAYINNPMNPFPEVDISGELLMYNSWHKLKDVVYIR